MEETNRAVLCSESKDKVPKEDDLHGWIEDKTKDQLFYCSPMHPKRRSPLLRIVFGGFVCFMNEKGYSFHPFELTSPHCLEPLSKATNDGISRSSPGSNQPI